ncbi:MAG: hypothetical protein JWP78_2687 [Mucilaginibacter sp.]|nr:hypothetical protein [Mucilaginibacter sp.]
MRSVSKLFFVVFLTCNYFPFAKAQTTIDNITCLGNGTMAVYEAKADVIQLFGPPYSAPSAMEIKLDTAIKVVSERENGTAIWKHVLFSDNKKIGEMTDYIVAGIPGFIRQIKNTQPLIFTIQKPAANAWINTQINYAHYGISGAALSKTPAGTFVYSTYPMANEAYHMVITKGNNALKNSGNNWYVKCNAGESSIIVVGGPSYPECITNTSTILNKTPAEWLAETRKWWLDFTARRINFNRQLTTNVPAREKLLQTIDDIAVLIKTQQSTEGAVLAGHNYHMGYVRDQYGVSRGLLRMGYYPEARAILNFYWNVWYRKGVLHNAQGIGMDAFHIHENDNVELSGYLIMQAFDYFKKTNDKAFIKQIFPMLEWAWHSQQKQLIKHMLPFNGDETYVAGDMLPRSALLDGSSEATMLFLTSSDPFLQWIDNSKSWPASDLADARLLVKQVKEHFSENFIENGKLLTNNPRRMEGEVYPGFRHGVCESCRAFGWTQKTENNRYLCPVCFATKTLPKAEPKKYFIPSVTLIPLYINASILTQPQIKFMVDDIVSSYKKTGKLSSGANENTTVGYDYGFFLYSLSKLKDPLQTDIYINMLDVLDKTGAWVEYYQNNMPKGTRYRPWESAINIEAAIDYALNYNIR